MLNPNFSRRIFIPSLISQMILFTYLASSSTVSLLTLKLSLSEFCNRNNALIALTLDKDCFNFVAM